MENYSILIIDDGSTDTTEKIVHELQNKHFNLTYKKFRKNRGKAAALKLGFETALQNSAEVVIMMDADGQDDPTELKRLLQALDEGYDLITGARQDRQDRFIKKHSSKLYNYFTRLLTKAPGRDFNSGFKVMKSEVAAEVSEMLYGELHRYITVIAHWSGFRIYEVEVTHKPRLYGKSKYGISRFWRGLIDLITINFLLTFRSRPSHLFGGLGATSVGIGSVILFYLLYLRAIGESIGGRPLLILSVLLISVGFQFLLFGLLSELIVYQQKRKTDK